MEVEEREEEEEGLLTFILASCRAVIQGVLAET